MKLFRTALVLALVVAPGAAQAGVFNTSQFIGPDQWSLGLEPEVILSSAVRDSSSAGAGLNIRYTRGLNELSNASLILGTGGGPRAFRAGGQITFDLFPDAEYDLGAGVATRLMYVRVPSGDAPGESAGRTEVGAIPYLHKSFGGGGVSFDPFLAFPVNLALAEGRYVTATLVAFGTAIRHSEKIQSVLEVGVNINHSESYVSGGVVIAP